MNINKDQITAPIQDLGYPERDYLAAPTRTNKEFLREIVPVNDAHLICRCGHDVELHGTTLAADGKYHIGSNHRCVASGCTCNWFATPTNINNPRGTVFDGDLELELFDELRSEHDAPRRYRAKGKN